MSEPMLLHLNLHNCKGSGPRFSWLAIIEIAIIKVSIFIEWMKNWKFEWNLFSNVNRVYFFNRFITFSKQSDYNLKNDLWNQFQLNRWSLSITGIGFREDNMWSPDWLLYEWTVSESVSELIKFWFRNKRMCDHNVCTNTLLKWVPNFS